MPLEEGPEVDRHAPRDEVQKYVSTAIGFDSNRQPVREVSNRAVVLVAEHETWELLAPEDASHGQREVLHFLPFGCEPAELWIGQDRIKQHHPLDGAA